MAFEQWFEENCPEMSDSTRKEVFILTKKAVDLYHKIGYDIGYGDGRDDYRDRNP